MAVVFRTVDPRTPAVSGRGEGEGDVLIVACLKSSGHEHRFRGGSLGGRVGWGGVGWV